MTIEKYNALEDKSLILTFIQWYSFELRLFMMTFCILTLCIVSDMPDSIQASRAFSNVCNACMFFAIYFLILLILLPEANNGLRVLSSPASVCVCVCICVCMPVNHQVFFPDDNLSAAQGTITKIGPEVQNTLVKIPIVFGVH